MPFPAAIPMNRPSVHRLFPIRILPILAVFAAAVFAASLVASAQGGNAGPVRGTVTDPSGAVIPNATIRRTNQVSGLDRTATTDATGQLVFANVPFNPYSVSATAAGFGSTRQNTEIRSSVGVTLQVVLQIEAAQQTVTVQASGDLVETDPTFHSDVDRDMFVKVPLESASSSLSSLVTETTPGVSADSNGLFHGLGDHAETRSPWMASPSPISRARSFPTRFRLIPFNRSK